MRCLSFEILCRCSGTSPGPESKIYPLLGTRNRRRRNCAPQNGDLGTLSGAGKPGARPTRISKKPKTNVHQIMGFFIADCWHNGNEHVFCALDQFHVVRNKKTIGSTSRLAKSIHGQQSQRAKTMVVNNDGQKARCNLAPKNVRYNTPRIYLV